MKLITSIGPNRIERQQHCINSWLARDCEVVAVQSKGETDKLKPHFPSVSFVETDKVGDVFGRTKSVRISALLDQITDIGMLINSDIEIITRKEDFNKNWSELSSKSIKMGIRWDSSKAMRKPLLLKYGIDVFLLSQQAAKALPDIGMTIGCPGWDYWVPWHLNKLDFRIQTSKEYEFVHEVHPQNWSRDEYSIGIKLLTENYTNLTSAMLTHFILELTDRAGIKYRKPRE